MTDLIVNSNYPRLIGTESKNANFFIAIGHYKGLIINSLYTDT